MRKNADFLLGDDGLSRIWVVLLEFGWLNPGYILWGGDDGIDSYKMKWAVVISSKEDATGYKEFERTKPITVQRAHGNGKL